MAKKISQQEFESRIKETFPDVSIEILEYTKISGHLKARCLKCGKIHEYQKASTILKNSFCCNEENTLEGAKRRLAELDNFHFVKELRNREMYIFHDDCGRTFSRKAQLVLQQPNHCPYCSDNKGIKFTIEEAQQDLDEQFFGTIKILNYNAVRTKNTYKCIKCGLIFQQTLKNLLASRGCPKCDRFKSKGETQLNKILTEHNILFKEQVSFPDLSEGRQKVDFVIYKDKNYKQILYFIECQGEQHYEEKDCFRDSLAVIQERDERKRQYCKQKNIPLYEIVYKDGKLLNLEILPFEI